LPHEAFRLSNWPMTYAFRLHPLSGGEDLVALSKQSVE